MLGHWASGSGEAGGGHWLMQGRGGGDESWIGFLHPSEQGQSRAGAPLGSWLHHPLIGIQEQMLDPRQGWSLRPRR